MRAASLDSTASTVGTEKNSGSVVFPKTLDHEEWRLIRRRRNAVASDPGSPSYSPEDDRRLGLPTEETARVNV